MKRRFYGRVRVGGRLYRASVTVDSKELPAVHKFSGKQLREYVRSVGNVKCFFKVINRVWDNYAAFYQGWPHDSRTEIEWWRVCECHEIQPNEVTSGKSIVYVSGRF